MFIYCIIYVCFYIYLYITRIARTYIKNIRVDVYGAREWIEVKMGTIWKNYMKQERGYDSQSLTLWAMNENHG